MIKRLSLLLLLVGLFLINPHCANVEQNQNIIRSVKVKEVPFKDVRSSIWKKAPVTQVNVIPQNMTLPSLQTPTIQYINVRSLHNDNWIAFLLEWEDKTRDAVVDVNKFTDQVAVQLPLDPKSLPAFMMGNKGGRVHIIHWKAIWQDDIEKGYRDVKLYTWCICKKSYLDISSNTASRRSNSRGFWNFYNSTETERNRLGAMGKGCMEGNNRKANRFR